MSNYLAYYLKYRPQTLSELICKEAFKQNLLSGFQNNKLSHAYLFVGPRGTGKTSTARILAKMVNCSAEQNAPCNKCEICTSITDGSNLDLIEIDAASNRGIEDIRSLREKIKLAPTSSKKKVYIIDEAHMLTTEAFNALLKTLEEPPSHVLFILATTELGKIPQTILSRVQRLDFKLATPKELLEALTRIVREEKIDIDEESLKILVKKSDGSFRDGVKLLDQISGAGGKITANIIEGSLQSSQFENILNLIQNFKDKNVSDGLLEIGKQIEGGIDIKELTLSLMDTLRGLILIKNGVGEQLVKPQLTEDKFGKLIKVAEDFTNQELILDLNILQVSLEKLKFTSIPSLPLELAVVEICEESAKLEEQVSEGRLSPNAASFKNLLRKTLRPEGLRVRLQADRIRGDQPQDVYVSEQESGAADQSSKSDELASEAIPDVSTDIQKIKEKWTFVLETIRPFNFSLEALLRSINIIECTDISVVMEVPYSFHQRILEAPKNRDLLESILSEILGRNIRISTVLGNRPSKAEDIANVELAADDEIIRAAAEIFNSDTVN